MKSVQRNKQSRTVMNTRRKMELAQQLIDGLQGERERWTEDSKLFKAEKKSHWRLCCGLTFFKNPIVVLSIRCALLQICLFVS